MDAALRDHPGSSHAPVPSRDRICQSLRPLATYFDKRPGVPVTAFGCQITEFTQTGDDDAGIAEVDRVTVTPGRSRHLPVSRAGGGTRCRSPQSGAGPRDCRRSRHHDLFIQISPNEARECPQIAWILVDWFSSCGINFGGDAPDLP